MPARAGCRAGSRASSRRPRDDPLLFIESVPLAETRGYLKKVLANLWAYQARAGGTAPSLQALAENRWPEVGPAPAPPPRPKAKPSREGDGQCPGGLTRRVPFQPLRIAVLTVSDTRTAADDRSGDTLAERIAAAGHQLAARAIVRDDRDADRRPAAAVDRRPRGRGRDHHRRHRRHRPRRHARGPGRGRREAHRRLRRAVPHAQLRRRSAPPSLQSRADAAVAAGTYIFCLPGSPGACRDGWDEILRFQLDIRHRPCNFAELLPRLREHERQG